MTRWQVELDLIGHGRMLGDRLLRGRGMPIRGAHTATNSATAVERLDEAGPAASPSLALCCLYSMTPTDKAAHASGNPRGRLRKQLRIPKRASPSYEDNEHDIAARQYFAKHGYRPLTEAQSNAVTLIGIVRSRC